MSPQSIQFKGPFKEVSELLLGRRDIHHVSLNPNAMSPPDISVQPIFQLCDVFLFFGNLLKAIVDVLRCCGTTEMHSVKQLQKNTVLDDIVLTNQEASNQI